MMRWIVGSSLQFRLLVLVAAAVTMFFGIKQSRNMPVDVLPEFTRPYVEIQTEALGLSAEEVEAMITTPMEADLLNGTPWVDEIRSESIHGLSSIKLFFEPGTDLLDARQVAQEHLSQVYALPSVSRAPTMLQPVSSTSRCITVGLSSDELSLIQMSVLARWTVKPRLTGLPGVANVSIWGQRERQLQVRVDPKKLEENGISLNQIISTTGNALWVSPLTFLDASVPGTGGFIDTPNQRLGIQHIFPISTAAELAQVPVEGSNLQLGDVATVVEDHQPLIGDAVVNDGPALLLVIEKFPWASTVEVTRRVEQALADLRPGLAGLEMDSQLFRPATFIETALQNLSALLLVSGALLVVTLFAFLNSWRVAVITLSAIVLSIVTALIVIALFGAPMNMYVLAGLLVASGVIVDDAIASTQNIVRRLRQHRAEMGSPGSKAWIIREATVELQSVLLYATLIILLTVLPVLFMGGVSGSFFQPLAYAYALAMLSSLLVALVVTPVLSVLLYEHAPLAAEESSWLAASARRQYDAIFGRVMQNPAPAFATAALILVAAVIIAPRVRQESLFPKFKEMDVMVSLDGRPGMSHPAMSRVVSQLSRELRAIPAVKNVAGQMGRAVTSDAVADINSCEIWLSIDPTADYDAAMAEIKRIVDGYPGFDSDLETYLDERITEELSGEDRGLVVRVYGDDLKIVRGKAEEVKRRLAKIDGVGAPHIEPTEEASRVEIEPNLERCKAHGVTPGEVRRAATTLLSGIHVGNLFDEQKVFEVVVWGIPEIRDNLSSVKNLLIESPLGSAVHLEDVADVRVVSGPVTIEREAVARYIDVVADVGGRDLAAIGGEVERNLAEINFPLEYRAEMLGETAERIAGQQRIRGIAVAAAIGVFLLFQAVSGSWRLASLLVLLMPLALVGGLLSAYAAGGLITIGSIVGFVAVLGIAVRNAVLLIHRYQSLATAPSAGDVDPEVAQFRAHYSQDVPLDDVGEAVGEITPEMVLRATQERFLPTLLTAIATACVFLPFVFFSGLPGNEIMYPTAVVILGGLVSATIVNLYVLPALYLWLQAQPQPDIATEPITVVQSVDEARQSSAINGEAQLTEQSMG